MATKIDWRARFAVLLDELTRETEAAHAASQDNRWDLVAEHCESAAGIQKRMASVAQKIHDNQH